MAETSPLVVVLMGVAGSGKSTVGEALSRALGWPFRDADSFHPPANVEKMSRGVPLTDADRAPWLAAIAAWIDERREAGKPAIVSCSALKRAYRQRIVGERDRVRLVYLHGDIGLIGARLSRRQARGQVFVPFHFREAAANLLTNPALDPYAKIASFKVSAVRLERVE